MSAGCGPIAAVMMCNMMTVQGRGHLYIGNICNTYVFYMFFYIRNSAMMSAEPARSFCAIQKALPFAGL